MQAPSVEALDETDKVRDSRVIINANTTSLRNAVVQRVAHFEAEAEADLVDLTTATKGDVASIDTGDIYRLLGEDPTVLGNWKRFTNADDLAEVQTAAALYTDVQLGLRAVKEPVRVVVTTNVDISSPDTAIFDAVTLTEGVDSVLLAGQTLPAENGIYLFATSSTAMVRRSDANSSAEMKSGMLISVREGTHAGELWTLSTDGAITLDTTELTFEQIAGGVSDDGFDLSDDQSPTGVWTFREGGLFVEDQELKTQGSYQIASTLDPVSVTNTTTKTVVAFYTLPADTFDNGDVIRLEAVGTLTNTSGAAVTVVPTFDFGTISTAGAAGSFADAEDPYQWRFEAEVLVSSPEAQDITARLVVLKATGEEVWHAKVPSTHILSTARTLSLSITLGTADTDITWATTSGRVFRTPPSPGQISPVLWYPDYDSVVAPTDTVQGIWFREQEPNNPGSEGPLQTTRISIVGPEDVPGAGNYKPLGNAMKVILQRKETSSGANDGDVQGGSYNRSEVYDRYPEANALSTPPANWPDPVGSERWYGIPVYFPTDHVFATGSEWFTFTQWKQLRGGSPPLSLEVNKSNFRLGGTRGGSFPAAGYINPVTVGVWHLFVVGIKFSRFSGTGWVTVYHNGALKIPKKNVSTMDTYSGDADPMYLKQGIYRTAAFTVTHTLFFGPTVVGRKRNDVLAQLPDLIAMP